MIQRDSAITLATLGKVEFPIYSLYPSYPFFPSRHSFHVFELIRYLSLLLEHSYLNTLTPAGLHQITSCCCNFLQILWSHEPDSVRSTIPSLDYYQQMCVLSELAPEQSNEVKSIDRILTQLLKLFEKQESETGEIPKEPSFLVNVPTDPFDRAMYIQLCQIISVIEMDSESIRTIRLYTSNIIWKNERAAMIRINWQLLFSPLHISIPAVMCGLYFAIHISNCLVIME